MVRRYVKAIVDHPWATILLVAAVTVFFSLQFRSLTMVLDPKRILPQDHPYVQLNNKIEALFGGSRVVVIGVVAREGDIFTPAILGKISRLTEEVKKLPGAVESNVVSIADRKIKAISSSHGQLTIRKLMEAVPQTPEESAELRRNIFANPMYVGTLVSRDGRAAAIIADFRGGATPQNFPAVNPPVPPDNPPSPPFAKGGMGGFGGEGKGEGGGEDWKKWQGKSGGWQGGGWGGGWWKGAQGCPRGEQAAAYSQWYVTDLTIYRCLTEITDKEKDAATSIHLGGLPIALAFLEMDTTLMNTYVFPLAVLIIMGVLYLSLRTFQGMMVPIATALLSVVWALGLMGFLQIPLDPWTKTLTPILIVAIAAGHSVQILARYYEELERLGSHKDAVIESTTTMAPVMVTAGLVAAASFASLVTFQLKTFQSFGLLTAFGILSALVLEMTFIPAARTLLPAPRPAQRLRMTRQTALDRLLEAIARTVSGPGRKAILVGGALIFIVALALSSRVVIANSLKGQFFERTALRQDDAVLNEAFGGTSTFYVLLEGEKDNALKEPEVMAAIDALQRRLEGIPGVGKTQSYVDYVKRINRVLHNDDPAHETVPQTRGEAADYLLLFSFNPADFDRLVDNTFRRAVVWAFLKSDSTRLADQLIQEVNALGFSGKGEGGGGSRLTAGVAGSAPVTVALNDVMVKGKIGNILQVAGITFLIVSAVRRSFLGGLFVMIPLSLAVLCNFAFMGVSGIPLGIGTAAIAAMAVGMGADYDIYLLFRWREEFRRAQDSEKNSEKDSEKATEKATFATLGTAGKAITYVAGAISAGCATLAFPGYYLHMEGILVPLAMLSSALAALLLLPALVLTFRPAFVFGRPLPPPFLPPAQIPPSPFLKGGERGIPPPSPPLWKRGAQGDLRTG